MWMAPPEMCEVRLRDILHSMTMDMRAPNPSMRMMTEGYEFRYEQTGDTFRLQSFYGAPRLARLVIGPLRERPDWLLRILDVAAVAGVLRHPVAPPDVILWFRTDQDHNLTEYVDL